MKTQDIETLKAKREVIAFEMIEAEGEELQQLQEELEQIEEAIDKHSEVTKKILNDEK